MVTRLSGSPPRMRGKLYQMSLGYNYRRITPAHAGKTTRAPSLRPCRPDHPRACGENMSLRKRLKRATGSPPRMRGKRLGCLESLSREGITPAHAGKTVRPWSRISTFRDHPRACGENKLRSPSFLPTLGSPPRMRGKRPICLCSLQCQGITPAHAGKTTA